MRINGYGRGALYPLWAPDGAGGRYADDLELLSEDVVNAAYDYFEDLRETAPTGAELQRAIVRLADRLRQYHYDGDGCIEDDHA